MTLAQLFSKLLGSDTEQGLAFPLGTPENLRPQCEQMIVEGLIEIQRWNECWQVGHFDVHRASQVMVQNGTSVVTKPEGKILEVFTIETTSDGSGWDRAIGYDPVDLWSLRRWMGRYRQGQNWLQKVWRSPAGQEGFRQPLLEDNDVGRALSGCWAIDKATRRIIVAPWLQSNESLVVKWEGIKRNWVSTDLVSDNPDFVRLVKLWLLQEFGRHWASSDLSTRVATWVDAQADAIVDCRNTMQLPERGAPPDEVAQAKAYYETNPPTAPAAPTVGSSLIVFVGDTGTANADAQAVAAAITAAAPELVVIAGDAVYQPNTPAQALAPYQSFIDANRLVVALGNHDLDVNNGADVVDYVSNPGNGRYFSVAIGPVEVFVANSGINTEGLNVETDGNFGGSIQWSALRAMIQRSCAPWKVLVIHHPPYTSSATYSPGVALARWASDMEVHAVISGHAHNYERGVFRGRHHIVVGTGGAALVGFVEGPCAGSEEQVQSFGFLKLEATKTTAVFKFVNLAGTVVDQLTLAGDPPVSSTEAQEEAMTQVWNDEVQAGATYEVAMFVREPNGQAVSLVGASAVLQARRTVGGAVEIELTSSPASGLTITGAEGRIDILMSSGQTALLSGVYLYQLEVTYADTTVERVAEGTWTISPEIVTP